MTNCKLPALISTGDPNSFAEFTIKTRKPNILERVLTENRYSETVNQKVRCFREELAKGSISKLAGAPGGYKDWDQIVSQYDGKGWLDVPWFFAETYFYRKLCDLIGYYDGKSENFLRDPFQVQKTKQMEQDLAGMVQSGMLQKHERGELRFETYVEACLWGNRADLSNITVDLSHAIEELSGAAHLEKLINDCGILKDLVDSGMGTVSYFVDNVGREFFSDLLFLDFLLRNQLVQQINLFVKPSPFFVSDVMVKDVEDSIQMMIDFGGVSGALIGNRLKQTIHGGIIQIFAPEILSSPLMYQEMGEELIEAISSSDLVVMKGDANYRRLLGDRKWPVTTKTEAILDYLAMPCLMIRTLKAEIMTGLAAEKAEELSNSDATWLTSGNYGLVQLIQ